MAFGLLRMLLAGALLYAAVASGAQGGAKGAEAPARWRAGDLALTSLPLSLGAATRTLPDGRAALTAGSRRAPVVADMPGSGGIVLPPPPFGLMALAAATAAGAGVVLALTAGRGLIRRRGPPFLLLARS
jgi:hypothetical protein